MLLDVSFCPESLPSQVAVRWKSARTKATYSQSKLPTTFGAGSCQLSLFGSRSAGGVPLSLGWANGRQVESDWIQELLSHWHPWYHHADIIVFLSSSWLHERPFGWAYKYPGLFKLRNTFSETSEGKLWNIQIWLLVRLAILGITMTTYHFWPFWPRSATECSSVMSKKVPSCRLQKSLKLHKRESQHSKTSMLLRKLPGVQCRCCLQHKSKLRGCAKVAADQCQCPPCTKNVQKPKHCLPDVLEPRSICMH